MMAMMTELMLVEKTHARHESDGLQHDTSI